jgi:DNA-binding NarL/FixJ family response regulator
LAPREGFEVVAECADGDEVEAAVDTYRPDLVIMDARMKRMGGAEATRRLRDRASSPPVLVLTTFDDDEVLSATLRAGASGFQLKDAPGEDLIRSAKVVAEGGAWLDPTVTARVLAAYRSSAQAPPDGRRIDALTEREREVLGLIGRGLSNPEIAKELYISEVTVKSHVGHIFTKLDLRDRAAAIVYAFDNGVVQPQT